jgi:hypothetical protein
MGRLISFLGICEDKHIPVVVVLEMQKHGKSSFRYNLSLSSYDETILFKSITCNWRKASTRLYSANPLMTDSSLDANGGLLLRRTLLLFDNRCPPSYCFSIWQFGLSELKSPQSIRKLYSSE